MSLEARVDRLERQLLASQRRGRVYAGTTIVAVGLALACHGNAPEARDTGDVHVGSDAIVVGNTRVDGHGVTVTDGGKRAALSAGELTLADAKSKSEDKLGAAAIAMRTGSASTIDLDTTSQNAAAMIMWGSAMATLAADASHNASLRAMYMRGPGEGYASAEIEVKEMKARSAVHNGGTTAEMDADGTTSQIQSIPPK